MVRQTSKKTTNNNDQNEDLLFMLSCIRSRENALVFFLELFTIAAAQKLTSQQYAIYKQEFLQKQKINTLQIKNIVEKNNNSTIPPNQLKSFWIKLKSILRVSLERVRTLGAITESLEQCYEAILKLIDGFYSTANPIKQYLQIQQLAKRRTIQALMSTKHLFTEHSSQDFGKIRSQTFLKGSIKSSDSFSCSPVGNKEKPLTSIQEMAIIKESNRVRRKQKIKTKAVNLKKIQSNLFRYQNNLADIMDMRIDYHLDKKKAQGENITSIYDNLFSKNIHNHKIITKYSHSCRRLMQKIVQIKRAESQRKSLTNNKLTQKRVHEQTETVEAVKSNQSKHKLRPKTSKQPKKTLQLKGSSSKNQKVYDLIKMI